MASKLRKNVIDHRHHSKSGVGGTSLSNTLIIQALGALGSSPHDDGPTLQAAILAAKASGLTSYTFPTSSQVMTSITLTGIDNFTINLGTIKGSVSLPVSALSVSDPRYDEIPAGVKNQTWVGSLPQAGVGNTSPFLFATLGKFGPGYAEISPVEVFQNSSVLLETSVSGSTIGNINSFSAYSGARPFNSFVLGTNTPWSLNNWAGNNRSRAMGYISNVNYFYHEGAGTLDRTGTWTWDSPGSPSEPSSSDTQVRVRITGILELLSLGTYYVDLNAGKVYICAAASGGFTVSSNVNAVFKIGSGCNNLTIKGGSITETRWHGIWDTAGTNTGVAVSGIVFDTGGFGIISTDGRGKMDGWNICNNRFSAAGAGIFCSAGNKSTLTTGNCVIQNNTFDGTRERARSYTGGICFGIAVGVTVSGNTFQNYGGLAIATNTMNDCIFDSNFYNNCCLTAGDSGVIYHGKQVSNWGNIFRNERFLNCGARSNAAVTDPVCNCIYLDDGTSGVTVTNISATGCQYVVFIGGGHSIKVNGVTSVSGATMPISMDQRFAGLGIFWDNDFQLGLDFDAYVNNSAYAKYGTEFTTLRTAGHRDLPTNCSILNITASGGTPAQHNYSTDFVNAPVTQP